MTALAVLTSVVSFLVGLWGATYLQDRENRRRHLGILRALAAEVNRIATESGVDGGLPIPITFLGMRPALPTLSAWVPTILTDIASTSPEVVEKFLALDRFLDNLRHVDSASDQLTKLVAAKREALEQAGAAAEGAPLEDFADALIAKFKAKQDAERTERNADLAEHGLERSFGHVQSAVNDLRQLLSRLESDLSKGLWTHLPWRRA